MELVLVTATVFVSVCLQSVGRDDVVLTGGALVPRGAEVGLSICADVVFVVIVQVVEKRSRVALPPAERKASSGVRRRSVLLGGGIWHCAIFFGCA